MNITKKAKSLLYSNKNTLIIFLYVFSIFIFFNAFIAIFTDFSIQSKLYLDNLLSGNELSKFRYQVIIYRILVYFIMPLVSFLLYLIFRKKTIQPRRLLIGTFYEMQFILISIITSFYILGAMDIINGYMIFTTSDAFVAIVGFILIKVFKQDFRSKKDNKEND